ncbi:hypothetical protein MHYP_G00184190 [Metynnis hypsauchen]
MDTQVRREQQRSFIRGLEQRLSARLVGEEAFISPGMTYKNRWCRADARRQTPAVRASLARGNEPPDSAKAARSLPRLPTNENLDASLAPASASVTQSHNEA